MVELYQPLLRGEHYRVGRVDEGLEVVARLLPRGPVLSAGLLAKANALEELASMGLRFSSEDDVWLVAYVASRGITSNRLGPVLTSLTR